MSISAAAPSGTVRRAWVVAALAAFLAVALSGCADLQSTGTPTARHQGPRAARASHTAHHRHHTRATRATRAPSASASPTTRPGAGTALGVLARLPVKGRAPMTGYDRDEFGPAWLDANHNGCDTRNDMLARDLTHLVYERGTYDCVVVSGDLADPYTARLIRFVRGDGTLVDIDHVVALGNAWVTGAFRWDIHQRAALANDPMNLLPVDASANRQKGDGDAATWLPANRSFRCAYVARQVGVKAKYGLWVTSAERDAMARVLTGCPGQRVAADSGAPTAVTNNITDPAPSSAPTRTPGTALAGGSVYYANCGAARAAGAAPLRRGDPGYGAHLDGDGDGIACE